MYTSLPSQSHQSQTNIPTDDDHFHESMASIPSQYLEEAIFAGGSFCGLEAAYGLVDGVLRTATGDCGCALKKPTYREVCEGSTGHTEAIKVFFDNRKVSYKSLCDHFWGTHDPTNREYLNFGIGTRHQSAIFYSDDNQRKQAQGSKIRRQMKLHKKIVTKITPRESDFFLAENQHQKYYLQRDYIWVCELLNLRSTEQFVESFIASKLNGILFLNGSKTVEYLKRFVETPELSKHTKLVCKRILEDLEKNEAEGMNNSSR